LPALKLKPRREAVKAAGGSVRCVWTHTPQCGPGQLRRRGRRGSFPQRASRRTDWYPVAHVEEQQGGVVDVDGAPERLEAALDALKVSRAGRSSEHARPGDNGRLPVPAAAFGRQELAQGEHAEVGAGLKSTRAA